MKMPKISGIYCIENILDGKKYIGQAKDFTDRYETHLYSLRRGKGDNWLLQASVDNIGLGNFDFYVIEYCDNDLLDEREIYWIDYYHTFTDSSKGYNL